MNTGVIVTAERKDDGSLNHFQVSRVDIKGEEWEKNTSNELNVEDMNTWTDIMVEGIITVIYVAHENKLVDSAKFLRDVIGRLEQSFIVPADVNVQKNPKEIVSKIIQEHKLLKYSVMCRYCMTFFGSDDEHDDDCGNCKNAL